MARKRIALSVDPELHEILSGIAHYQKKTTTTVIADILNQNRMILEAMLKAYQDYEKKEEELTKELHSIVGYALSPKSSKQLQQYFYKEKGLPPYHNLKTGKVSCDSMALKRLARKGIQENDPRNSTHSVSARLRYP